MAETRQWRRWLIAGILLGLLPVIAWGTFQGRRGETATRTTPPLTAAAEAIALLQRQMDSGSAKLDFDVDRGYLPAVLKALKIPVSSQGLVFGKNSFQLDLISPESPRAIYFNDDVYVGFVQGGQFLEVISIDPKLGPVFYTLRQDRRNRPTFEKETSNCIICHNTGGNQQGTGIPRLVVLSTITDSTGVAMGQVVYSTTDKSPLAERFGGWYVTGTHGDQKHMGNLFAPFRSRDAANLSEYVKHLDLKAGANVTSLTSRFDTKPYLSPHSDMVALMVLAHQSQVHNFITRADYRVNDAVDSKASPEKLQDVVTNSAEPIVGAMLFSGAAPLTAPIAGTSGFAAEFSMAGKRDHLGRSLKDLDLKTRLLRYPMSYLIYTDSFNQMPAVVKTYVYRRFRDILLGRDQSVGFAHLSAGDRQAILEILKDTKPDFAAFLSTP